MSLEASATEPLTSVEMPFLPMEDGVQGDVTAGPEWGTGRPVYIMVTVRVCTQQIFFAGSLLILLIDMHV